MQISVLEFASNFLSITKNRIFLILFRNLKNSRVLIYKGTDDETFCMVLGRIKFPDFKLIINNPDGDLDGARKP